MSFVDLLFPLDELEALGNKWHEPAPKRRKVESGSLPGGSRAIPAPTRQNSESSPNLTHRRPSTPSSHNGKASPSQQQQRPSAVPKARTTSMTSAPSPTATTTSSRSKSCLPSFIEPSILKNYLHHLHPNDRHRYSLPSSPRKQSSSPQSPKSAALQTIAQQQDNEDSSVPSPASLTTDATSSPSSSDSCPTPAAICDQFRSGPFGHIFDGMRITDIERNMMEDLLSPNPSSLGEMSGLNSEGKPIVDILSGGIYGLGDIVSQKSLASRSPVPEFDFGHSGTTNADRDLDVHSSGLSPAASVVAEEINEEPAKDPSPRGIVVYDYSALSVDDFFDLEEAST